MSEITVAAHTLGCKANQHDTHRLLGELTQRGCAVTGFGNKADVYIINTCTVTHTAARKSLQRVRRARQTNPQARVAVCGCAVKTDGGDLAAEADLLFDARKPQALYDWLALTLTKTDAPAPPGRTRAYIKIQDGCDRFCAYCVVPYVRGDVTSQPQEAILRQAQALILNGTREIVLTGIHTAAYGKDLHNSKGLAGLVQAVAALPGLDRLRLGSIEPYAVDDAFVQAIQAANVCGHFHLSLQSGCDTVLQRMNRRYTTGDYARAAEALRQAKPDASLTTDIIAGFPGETDEEFEQGLQFVRTMRFGGVHVFEYSPREPTAAAALPHQVTASVKKQRSAALRQAAAHMKQAFLQGYVGRTVQVLFEARKDGFWQGHTANYMTVRAKGGQSNLLTDVTLTHIIKETLYGEVKA